MAILLSMKAHRTRNLVLTRKTFLPTLGASEMVAGVVAQLVERLVRNEKVAGSIPVGSTSLRSPLRSELRLGKPAFGDRMFITQLSESGERRLPRRSAA
jgi:hypothetical protein